MIHFIIFYVDYYIGSVIFCALVMKDIILNSIIAVLATLFEVTSSIFTGRYVVTGEGRPIRRTTMCGKEFFVKEPSIIKEIACHVRGKTILRDQNGVPITDDSGKFVKAANYKV